jgi:polysaccharide export outer membrane protein
MMRTAVSLMVAGLLVGHLALGTGCRSAAARKSGNTSVAPSVVATTNTTKTVKDKTTTTKATAKPKTDKTAVAKATVPETTAATTNKPSFFARVFGSKSSKPAVESVAATPAPVIAKPAPVVTQPAPETTAAPASKPGFFARLFGSKTAKPIVVTEPAVPAPAPVADTANLNTNKTFIPYRIQVNDTLIISLRGITPEQPNVEQVVNEHGEIKLPYINALKAEGRTTSELEELIRSTYIEQKIYKRLTVNIIIPAQTQPTFYVRGEVRTPGRVPFVSGMTLLAGIAAAGGPTDFASPNMTLLRGGKKLKFNYVDLEKHPEQDQPIQAGDIILVDKSWF